ncbi:MAG TPA: hypothetical protein VGR51_03160 [Thermoplasmata archaeon]|jgi:hypothetical protein|nr:hypothetical protein [Thermoplasmata archaeon]
MHRGLIVFLLLMLVVPVAQAHTVGSPAYVNLLLQSFSTPDLAPGERGPFQVTVSNPYPWMMRNIALLFEVYRYREIDVDRPVNASSWAGPGPSFFDPAGFDHGLAYAPFVQDLPPARSTNASFSVVTYEDTPHGSLTKQGSYFVRSRMIFELTDGVTTNTSVMMSKGWFTDAEWDRALQPCGVPDYCVGLLNMTYLGSLYGLNHLDGLLPDTAFSVKERMPAWPFVLVGGVMVASLAFAVLFYAEENPGKYPRLAQWWLGLKGKARSVRPPKAK